MTRTRATAKKAGATFERVTADWWRDNWDDRIDRRVKTGAKDRGDLANVRVGSHRIVVECKDERAIDLAGWVTEAQREAVNDEALLGIVVRKRRGKADPADHYVVMTQGDLLKLLKAATGATSV